MNCCYWLAQEYEQFNRFSGEASIKYKEKLQESIPSIDIVMWDERLSTMAAERSLLEADVSRQKKK